MQDHRFIRAVGKVILLQQFKVRLHPGAICLRLDHDSDQPKVPSRGIIRLTPIGQTERMVSRLIYVQPIPFSHVGPPDGPRRRFPYGCWLESGSWPLTSHNLPTGRTTGQGRSVNQGDAVEAVAAYLEQ